MIPAPGSLSTRQRLAIGALAAVTVAAAFACVKRDTAAAAADDPAHPVGTTVAPSAAATIAHWTPERMRTARPMPMPRPQPFRRPR